MTSPFKLTQIYQALTAKNPLLKKIIDEVDDQAPSIKYASGGLAYMLGE